MKSKKLNRPGRAPELPPASLLSRRDVLSRLGVGVLLQAGVWPGLLRAADATGQPGRFKFVAVNDLHHDTAKCDEWMALLMAHIKGQSGVEFCLVLGDLTDKGRRGNLGAVRDHLRTLKMPYHVQIGNHDYLTDTDRKAYEEMFPNNLNYHFEHRGWQFLGIDSSDGQRYTGTYVQDPTLRWLDDRLARLNSKQPTVVFTHFPLGMNVNYHPLNSDQVLDRFRDVNLQGVYSGHYHALTEREHRGVKVYTNRCCALIRNNHDNSKQKGYFVVTAENGRLTTEFVEFKGPPGLKA